MAQRSPIRSFLSVVPSNVSSNTENWKQSPRFSGRSDDAKSAPKTIQFPDLGSTNRSRSSVTPASRRISRSPGVKLPQMIPDLQSSTGSNLLLDPRISSSGNLHPRPSGDRGSVTLASSTKGLNHRSESSRLSPRMSNRQSQSGDKTTTSSSKHPQSVKGRSRSRNSANRSTPTPQPSVANRRRRDARRHHRHPRRISPLLAVVRLLILGVGLAAIGGTLLSFRDPAREQLAEMPASIAESTNGSATSTGNFQFNASTVLPLGQEITQLKSEIQTLTASYSQMTPGVFFVDLDNGAYLDMNGSNTFSAASTIKVPILIALFQEVDAGNVRLDEPLTMHSEYVAGGSGDMQYEAVGTEYTVLETARKMITISDNTATNMLIARLGGEKVLNQRFVSWGLTSTKIQNFLPDIEGTNTTSPKDLVSLMAMIEKGGLLSLRSRDRVLDIMQATENDALLPQGLGRGATIAHKTGNIGSVLADTGMVDMPNGKRYLASIVVKRPHDDPDAEEFIRQISEAAYKSFNGENGVAGNPYNR